MKINEQTLRKLSEAVPHPLIFGHLSKACIALGNADIDEGGANRMVRAICSSIVAPPPYVLPMEVVPAIAFFTSLDATTAHAFAQPLRRLRDYSFSELSGGMTADLQRGFFLGFLVGVGKSRGFSELDLRNLGHEFYKLVQVEDQKGKLESGVFGATLSDTVAKLSTDFPHFVDRFMKSLRDCSEQSDWEYGPFTSAVVDGFLHHAISKRKGVRTKLGLWEALSKCESQVSAVA